MAVVVRRWLAHSTVRMPPLCFAEQRADHSEARRPRPARSSLAGRGLEPTGCRDYAAFWIDDTNPIGRVHPFSKCGQYAQVVFPLGKRPTPARCGALNTRASPS